MISSGDSSSKNTINLATRRDVVNKTILRVLRRYLSCKFKSDVEQVYDGKSDKQTKYFSYVGNLAAQMFGERHSQIKLLHFYLASIIDHKISFDHLVGNSLADEVIGRQLANSYNLTSISKTPPSVMRDMGSK